MCASRIQEKKKKAARIVISNVFLQARSQLLSAFEYFNYVYVVTVGHDMSEKVVGMARYFYEPFLTSDWYTFGPDNLRKFPEFFA